MAFRIARNLMINLLAARRIRPQATGDSDVRELLERVPAPDRRRPPCSTPSFAAGSFTGRPSKSVASSATRPGRRSG